MSLTHNTVEQVKTATDAGMGVLGVTVILGWVNLAVGLCVVLWYMTRFYEYIVKKMRENKEKDFYLAELKEQHTGSNEYFSLLPLSELRKIYSKSIGKEDPS